MYAPVSPLGTPATCVEEGLINAVVAIACMPIEENGWDVLGANPIAAGHPEGAIPCKCENSGLCAYDSYIISMGFSTSAGLECIVCNRIRCIWRMGACCGDVLVDTGWLPLLLPTIGRPRFVCWGVQGGDSTMPPVIEGAVMGSELCESLLVTSFIGSEAGFD